MDPENHQLIYDAILVAIILAVCLWGLARP